MKLTIENIGKIRSAEIEFNGITVIGGENNTGKSTVGKVLFGIFNSCYDINNQIKLQKAIRFTMDARNIILSQRNNHKLDNYALADSLTQIDKNLVSKLLEATAQQNVDVYKLVYDFFNNYLPVGNIELDELVKCIVPVIDDFNDISEQEYMLSRISNYFSSLFDDQIVNFESSRATAILKIKNGEFKGIFNSNDCEKFSQDFSFTNNALFIDSPSIFDYYTIPTALLGGIPLQKRELIQRLKKSLVSDSADIDRAIVNQKLEDINELLSSAIPGTFDRTDTAGREQYLFKGSKKPVKISNLSAGVRSFLIIKKLLENNQFKQRDILILDEPEINLHPAWQLIYAETIVLLQEKLDLTVLLSTHSPYFLSAIEAFAKKHNRTEYCKFYLAESDNSLSTISDVTDNVNKIYLKLAKPLDVLEEIESDEE